MPMAYGSAAAIRGAGAVHQSVERALARQNIDAPTDPGPPEANLCVVHLMPAVDYPGGVGTCSSSGTYGENHRYFGEALASRISRCLTDIFDRGMNV